MKSILTILTLSILLTACGEKAPSVLEYLHDPVLMKEKNGWCMSNPAARESATCANLQQAFRFTGTAESVFFKCIKRTDYPYYKPDHECIDAKAKELGIK